VYALPITVSPKSNYNKVQYRYQLTCWKPDGTAMETGTIGKCISAEEAMGRIQNVIGFRVQKW
jgi:hypothetical protein